MLHYDFVDTDQALEARTGVTVSHIFEVEGAQGFRARESRLLAEISDTSRTVIATGGGIILAPANRKVMRNSGVVVYLRASLDLLWERLRGCQTRPLLNVADPKAAISELMTERDPLYTAEADYIVDVCAESAARMARQVCNLLTADEDRTD